MADGAGQVLPPRDALNVEQVVEHGGENGGEDGGVGCIYRSSRCEQRRLHLKIRIFTKTKIGCQVQIFVYCVFVFG